jgi:hypothetical protein
MLASVTVELDDTFLLIGLLSQGSADGKNISIWVPLAALDEHASVNEEWLGIAKLPHELESSTLVSDAETGGILSGVLVREALLVVIVPLNASEGHLSALDTSEALNLYRVLEVSYVVIDIDGAVWGSEQDGPAIRGPLNDLEVDLQLLAPQSGSLHTPDDHGSIFVDDTNLLAIGGPLHVGDHRLVPVIDHFFEPVLLVHHPHDDETLLVRGGQLLILVIPLDHLDLA